MKSHHLLTLLLLISLNLPAALACSTKLVGLETPIWVPPSFSVSKETRRSNQYENTQCLEFHVAKRKNSAGFLCSSSSVDFLTDFGISNLFDSTSNTTAQKKSRLVTVVTPMSSYNMNPIIIGGHRIYTSEVDCDEANESIYRATSTCHIAIMLLTGGRFLYSNFVLENHIESSRGVEKKDIFALWKKLKIATLRSSTFK